MAGNKALQKFKDSKIPKKGKGKIIIEVPIYKEPYTQSVIIGKLPKDEQITWISKSVCDEREWIRCDEKNNFGYIIGYEKDGKCNLDISSIKEKKEETKKEINFETKESEIIPITKEEISLGNEALREILNEDDKKSNKDSDSKSISTEVEESYFDIKNKSESSGLDDNKSKTSEIKIEEENWDNYFEDDISKIDFVKYENDKLLNEILCQIKEENNQSENEKKQSESSNKETKTNKERRNSVAQALSSIKDVLPANEKLSDKDKLLEALNLIPGGNKEKSSKKDKKNKEEDDLIKKSKTIKGKKLPKNFAKDGADYKQALKDAKKLNNIPKSNIPKEKKTNYDKRGKYQPGEVLVYKDANNKDFELRNDSEGHKFKDGAELGPHINDPDGRHFFYENNKKNKK